MIFSHILSECYNFRMIDHREVFLDTKHAKARANNKKMQKQIAHEKHCFMKICSKKKGKKPLKDKKDDDDNISLLHQERKKRPSKSVILIRKMDVLEKESRNMFLLMQ